MTNPYGDLPGYNELQPPAPTPPPKPRRYEPQVERWRPLAESTMPESLKARPDRDYLLEKYLFTMAGESSGNDAADHDGGNGYGLFGDRVARTPRGTPPEQQMRNAWSLVENNPNSWADWGEDTNYNGSNYGALGAPSEFSRGGTGQGLGGSGMMGGTGSAIGAYVGATAPTVHGPARPTPQEMQRNDRANLLNLDPNAPETDAYLGDNALGRIRAQRAAEGRTAVSDLEYVNAAVQAALYTGATAAGPGGPALGAVLGLGFEAAANEGLNRVGINTAPRSRDADGNVRPLGASDLALAVGAEALGAAAPVAIGKGAKGARAVIGDAGPRIAASPLAKALPDSILTRERVGANIARRAGLDPLMGARARIGLAGASDEIIEEGADGLPARPLPGQGGLFGGVVDDTGQLAPVEGVDARPRLGSMADEAFRGEQGGIQRSVFGAEDVAASADRYQPGLGEFEAPAPKAETPFDAELRKASDAELQEALQGWRNLTRNQVSDFGRKQNAEGIASIEQEIARRTTEKSSVVQPLDPANGIPRERHKVPVKDLEFRPDLFQARDADPGQPFGETRVKEIAREWDDARFIPPSAVPDPKTGKLIVYSGHHRSEAFKRVKGADALIDVDVTLADINDPAQLGKLRGLARAANFDTAIPNFREKVRAAEFAIKDGLSVENAASELRLTPSKVDELLDASRVGPQAIDRVVAEPALEPYVTAIGRGMRVHGITTEDANGLLARIASGTKVSRPTPAALRETLDKFGAILAKANADAAQGGLFGGEDLTGGKGGLLQLMDENARMRSQLMKARNAVTKAQKGANALADLPNATAEEKQMAARLVKLGADERLRIEAEIARNEENLTRAARGEPPLPEPEAAKVGQTMAGPRVFPNTADLHPDYDSALAEAGVPVAAVGKPPSVNDYLYHFTPRAAFDAITRDGLRPQANAELRGAFAERARFYRQNYGITLPRNVVYAADNAGILSAVDRDASESGWSLLRFKAGAQKWMPDPEWRDDPGAWFSRNPVPPENIEALTPEGWLPLKADAGAEQSMMPGTPPPIEKPPAPPRTPGARPPVGDEPIDQLIGYVEAAGAARPDLLERRRIELGKRVSSAAQRLVDDGVPPADAFRRARQSLKGKLADSTFQVPGELDADTLHRAIIAAVDNRDVQFFTGSAANEGLSKLKIGEMPQPNEVRALGQIFGPRLQFAIEEMGDVFKVQSRVENRLLSQPINITFPDNRPITPDVLGELLQNEIPNVPTERLQVVAERLIDEDKVRVSINKAGKASLTIGTGGPDRLGQAVADFIGGMDDIDELGRPIKRGLTERIEVPHQTIPPAEPKIDGTPYQPNIDQAPPASIGPSPAMSMEQRVAMVKAGRGDLLPPMPQGTREALARENAVKRAAREADWAAQIDAMPMRKPAAVEEMTQAEYEQALRDIKANAPGVGDFRFPADWDVNRRNAYTHLEYLLKRSSGNVDPAASTPAAGRPMTRSETLQTQRQYGLPGEGWQAGKESLLARIWKDVMAIPSLPKALLTTLDRSAVLRQGGGLIRHGQQVKDAIGATMFIAENAEDAAQWKKVLGFAPPNAEEVMQPVLHGKWSQVRHDAGLVVEDWGPNAKNPNEQFTSALTHKILGKLGSRMSERSYAVYLNKLRADVFDSVVEKWMREGRSFVPGSEKMIRQKDLTDLANYLNATTGRGTLGQFEVYAKAMSQMWFSPRNLVSRFQTIEMLFDPRTSGIVRKEMAKDLSVYIMGGITLLTLAQLSGLAEVELDPRATDFGKIRIGDTRIDFWGGYQQIARYGAQLISGQAKGSTGTIYGVDRIDIGLRYLRSKLSPSAGYGIDLLADDQMSGEEFDPLSLRTVKEMFVPLFLQDLETSIREEGPAGLATLPLTFFGVAAQSYSSPFEERMEARDALAMERHGVRYKDLVEKFPDKGFSYQAEINADPKVAEKNVAADEAGKNLPFGQDAEKRKQYADEIGVRREQAEQKFREGDLPMSLPEIYSDLAKEQAGARRQHEIDTGGFTADSAFDKALNTYYDQTVLDAGVVNWDATTSKQDAYLAKLDPKTRAQIEDFLGVQERKKSPLYQEYKGYIREREKQGYFRDGITQAEREAMDRANPELDVQGWYFRGGVRDKNAPTLQTPQAVDMALAKNLPNRDVRYEGLKRPINQDANSRKAWHESKALVVWYNSGLIAENGAAEGQRLARTTKDPEYAKPFDKMDSDHRSSIIRNLHEAAKKSLPELDAYLYWWGAQKEPSTQKGADYSHNIVRKYGSKAVEKAKP